MRRKRRRRRRGKSRRRRRKKRRREKEANDSSAHFVTSDQWCSLFHLILHFSYFKEDIIR